MDKSIFSLTTRHLNEITLHEQQEAINALENGQVVYLPNYFFNSPIFSQELLSEKILDGKHKNISYDFQRQKLGNITKKPENPHLAELLTAFMHEFAEFAYQTVTHFFPQYLNALKWGRTSYRPAEIQGRTSSKRKDDTRLHVDAFPATPVNGLRILRVFCNINPHGQPRVWHLGEDFQTVLQRFLPTIPAYNPTLAKLLQLIKATKSLRSAYDHYQLHLHDNMKLDDQYQTTVQKTRFDFPALTTWLVYTDQVSHAALSGQYLLEQTFYLPVDSMQNPELSPLYSWQKVQVGKQLVLTR